MENKKSFNRNFYAQISVLIFLAFHTGFVNSSFAAKTTANPVPLRDFFKNPEEAGHTLSPDGTQIAFLKPWESRMNVFTRNLSERPPGSVNIVSADKRVTEVKDRDISKFFWKSSSMIVFSRDFGGDENDHLFSANLKTGKIIDLTPFEKTRAKLFNDLEDVSDTDILVLHNHRDPKVFDVYRINTLTGASTLVVQNPGQFTSWVADHKGRVRLALEAEGLNTNVLYRDSEAQKFRKLFSYGYKDDFYPVAFTADNRNILAISNVGRDKNSIVEFNPQINKEQKIIYQHTDADVSSLSFSKKRKTLISADVITWKIKKVFFDRSIEKVFSRVSEEIKNQDIYSISSDKNEEKFIVRTYSDRSMGDVYFYDVKKDELKKIATLAPWLPEDQMAETKPIEYTSRDGLLIHGYLTLPIGDKNRKWPLVVNPHGGPWSRDTWKFNPQVQFLANRGYAVFQMNFRGSTGYGKKFVEASYKQWGKKMLDDVTDGVNWLIDKELVNKKKICIYGGSYGGYKTLAALAFTPDIYACGVDYVGVSNILTFMKTIPPYWTTELEKIYEMIGDPEKDKEQLIATSPALQANKIKAPLLIAQGAKDPRVKKSESDQMVEALRKRGIEVPYLVKENEGHGFRNEENRFEFYETMEKFLAKHIGE